MEYGLISNIDQFSDNKLLQAQQIQSINTSSKLDQQSKLEEVEKEVFLNTSSLSNVEKTTSEATKEHHEIVLTNTNFGFNDSSKDFFVKAVRGNSENQYPTEDMMRLKTYLMGLN
ncbi:hypothetical protein KO488_02655 [Poseidonibacter lekithochrous]|uniref:hypothetical protein n=1 Tax=Poseidonibacter TaxID=2321187 RepID=UPI001C09ACD4|nr:MULTISPECIES: hypothetical protein [Poseidonibacter]MBU3013643.1 hypothetical protein [Poseidonibacter lekithochrous]MDO6826940.1 hypothetical protein [Poseidonibacter sp. 1_MG-2023]